MTNKPDCMVTDTPALAKWRTLADRVDNIDRAANPTGADNPPLPTAERDSARHAESVQWETLSQAEKGQVSLFHR